MSRAFPWSDLYQKSQPELIDEIETCHARENSAAEGAAKLHNQNQRLEKENASLRGEIRKQTGLYEVAVEKQNELQEWLTQTRAALEDANEGKRRLSMTCDAATRRRADEMTQGLRTKFDALVRMYNALAWHINMGSTRSALKQLVQSHSQERETSDDLKAAWKRLVDSAVPIR